jgi:hypothetical protein
LCSLVIFVLYISGILLIFSMDTSSFYLNLKTNYIELPEIKENTLKDESEPVKKIGLQKYLHKSLSAWDTNQENSFEQEIKFYSPRNFVNKEDFDRKMKTARVNVETNLEYVEENSVQGNKEEGEEEEEGKMTHISFIEEEFENSLEAAKTHKRVESTVIKDQEKIDSHVKFALVYRFSLNFLVSMTTETLPYWIILNNYSDTVRNVSMILFLMQSIPSLIHSCISESILSKVPYIYIVQIFFIILILNLIITPVLGYYSYSGTLIIFDLLVIIYCIEWVLPVGCLVVCDSVPFSLRNSMIEKSDFYCIAGKVFSSAAGPLILYFFGHSPVCFIVNALGLVLLLLYSLKIPKYFPWISKAPYQL